MNSAIIELTQTTDLQQALEILWIKGIRSFELKGVYKARKNIYALLRIGEKLSGITINASGATLDGGQVASHVIVIENADVSIQGLSIMGGDTLGRAVYEGAKFRSIFEAIDGAGVLVLGDSNVKIKNCNILENHSGMCGGGLSNQGIGLVEIDNCSFENNTAYHTGSAVDNLTPGSKLVIKKSSFRNNKSNQGSICGGPHGQITIFKKTKAEINNCEFIGKSFPIDAALGSEIKISNSYHLGKPVEVVRPARKGTILDKLKYAKKLLGFEIRLLSSFLYPWVR